MIAVTFRVTAPSTTELEIWVLKCSEYLTVETINSGFVSAIILDQLN